MLTGEIFEFDLNGYIVYKNVFDQSEIQTLREILKDVDSAAGTGKFSFFDKHPIFAEIMAKEKTIDIVKNLCGEWVRFDHAIGLKMSKGLVQKQNLHGGMGKNQGAFSYQYFHGQMHNGLVKVLYTLSDVNSGDGGFVCIPGSHKSNIDYYPDSLESPLVVNPSMKAGDMLIFTEALIHGSMPWQADIDRFVLIYSYAPGCLAWKDPRTLDVYNKYITTEIQQNLMRPPYVGDYDERERLSNGKWPNARRNPTTEITVAKPALPEGPLKKLKKFFS